MQPDDKLYVGMRDFSRVDALVGLEVSRVPVEKRGLLASRYSTDASFSEHTGMPDVSDPALMQWLKMLNAKLDYIINTLALQNDGFHSLPSVRVNISGGGMSFESDESYPEGDVLELKILLPTAAPTALYLYGEVVKAENDEAGRTVSVRFIAIDDELRNEVFKFVFNKQREQLREKRR